MSFTFAPQSIPDVLLVRHSRFADERGSFAETYRADVFAEHGIPALVQHNHSRSVRGVVRGLHYQIEPAAVGKLVRCVRGRVLDVAVDIRRGSSTYARWVAVELEEEAPRMLWVPPGFAHGFCALSDVAEITYAMSGYYSPDHDRSIAWNDPEIGIPWPLQHPVLSAKDAAAPRLRDADNNFATAVSP